MADFYDTAAAGNDTAKASLLQAIATQGSQAKAAFDQAQQQIAAQRAQSLAAAIGASAQRGAPTEAQNENAATIGSGYDRRLADLASAQASNAGSLANISARGDSYLTAANAAIPSLRARQALADTTAQTTITNRLATLKSQQDAQNQSASRQETQFEQTLADRKAARDAAAAAATQAAQDRQDRLDQQAKIDAIQLAIAGANADKAQTGADAAAAKQAAPKGVDTVIGNTFGNQQGFADYVNQATALGNQQGQASHDAEIPVLRKLGAQGNLAARGEANLMGGYTPASASDVAEGIGAQLGFPAGVGSSLIAPAAAKTTAAQTKADAAASPDLAALGKNVGLSVKGVQDMLGSKEYTAAQQLAELYVQQGKTLDDLKTALGRATELQNKPKTRAAILYQYGHQLVSPSYIPAP